MARGKARQMRADAGGFDIDDFVAKLITFMGGRIGGGEGAGQSNGGRHGNDDEEDGGDDDFDAQRGLDWGKIGRRALARSRRVPAMDFMLGPLSVEQKKRAPVKRNKLEKSTEQERRPMEVLRSRFILRCHFDWYVAQIKEDDIKRSENNTTNNVRQVNHRVFLALFCLLMVRSAQEHPRREWAGNSFTNIQDGRRA